jgi:hypothetical protein
VHALTTLGSTAGFMIGQATHCFSNCPALLSPTASQRETLNAGNAQAQQLIGELLYEQGHDDIAQKYLLRATRQASDSEK